MSDTIDTPELRGARIEAARLARAAVAGEITTDEARTQWPLDENFDPSVDALAHIYFDHFVWTAKNREPDQDDVSSVVELADLMAEGEPLDDELLRGFESVWEVSFGGEHIALAVGILALIIYAAVRLL